MNESQLGGLVIAIIIAIVIFLALRAIMLWYWKIDEIIQNQRKTNFLLKKIAEKDGVVFGLAP